MLPEATFSYPDVPLYTAFAKAQVFDMHNGDDSQFSSTEPSRTCIHTGHPKQ